ncbi:MAG: EamA family transporter [Acinetobacter sp.]|nr:EamA family transporter [Acinetobacter sp.]
MKISTYYIALMSMILSMLSYQTSASFAKKLILELDALSVTLFRLVFATILVCIMFRSWRIIRQFSQVSWQDAVLYSFSMGLMNLLFYMSLAKIPLGIAVGLEFVGPLSLALLAIQQRRDYIWVVLAIVGIVTLVPWQQHHDFSVVGALLALAAGVCWALYIHFGQKVVKQNIGVHALTLGIGLSALTLLPIGLWYDAPTLLNPSYWGSAFMLALLATAFPYALDLYALKYLNKMSYGTLTSLSPAFAALSGWVLLHEYLSWLQLTGIACIVVASIGVSVFRVKNEQ